MIKRVICLKHKTKIIFLGMAAYTSIYTSRFRGTHMTTKSFFRIIYIQSRLFACGDADGMVLFFCLEERRAHRQKHERPVRKKTQGTGYFYKRGSNSSFLSPSILGELAFS